MEYQLLHTNEIVFPLLKWYQDNKRVLPWRENTDPYRVWVSEIMLQQTRVAAVIEYFTRFISACPTVFDLAKLDDDDLMKLWQGLGYYSRARNMRKAAKVIVDQYDGVFPVSYEEILKLPGIGDYTAGAISSISFGLPKSAVDGNVLRVMTRLTGDKSNISNPSTKKKYQRYVEDVIPRQSPGEFNQAVMELGAMVCIPNGEPHCDQCPVSNWCAAYHDGIITEIPVKDAPKSRRKEQRTVFLIVNNGRVALRKRPENGLLAGLWEYPNNLDTESMPDDWLIETKSKKYFGKGKHIFSHIEWDMKGVLVETETESLPERWVWASRTELDDKYAVPNAFRFCEKTIALELKGR